MAVSKERLREHLEGAMEDVALAMTDLRSIEDKLREVRAVTAEVWKMAELGDVPEWEVRVKAVKVS